MSRTLKQALFTDSMKKDYEEKGFSIARNLLSNKFLDECISMSQEWVEHTITIWMQNGLINHDFADLPYRLRLSSAWKAAGEPHYARSPRAALLQRNPARMYNILKNENLLALASEILDSTNIMTHSIWNLRPKASEQRYTDTPWHQDAMYFREAAHVRMVNMWFPMHDISEHESCLSFAPGMHKDGLATGDESEENNGFIGYCPEEAAKLPAETAPLSRGDVVFFTNLTPHRATSNTTENMRWSFDFRYIHADDANEECLKLGIFHPRAKQQTHYDEWEKHWESAEW